MKSLENAEQGADLNALLAEIPYVKFLGITLAREDGGLIATLNFHEALIGNPVLPALHGGAIGAFLETAAIVQIAYESKSRVLPKPIDITIDYLRSGKPQDMFAKARITKHGRRVANVQVEAWQDDPAKPVAAAHGHFLLTLLEEEGDGGDRP